MRRVFAFAFIFVFFTAVDAQTYPAKPVKLVIGFAAGGPTDVIARVMAQDMTQSLGQSFVYRATHSPFRHEPDAASGMTRNSRRFIGQVEVCWSMRRG